MHRMRRTIELVKKRLDAEEEMVETYSWLCHASTVLFSRGPREFRKIDDHHANQNKIFLKFHQGARDILADGIWVTRWLGAAVYCIILVWGAFLLLDTNTEKLRKEQGLESHHEAGEGFDFHAGDYVLLLKVCMKFGKYLAKVNTCVLKLQRCAVSIKEVRDLLNLPELSLENKKDDDPGIMKKKEIECRMEIGLEGPRRIQLNDVVLSLPQVWLRAGVQKYQSTFRAADIIDAEESTGVTSTQLAEVAKFLGKGTAAAAKHMLDSKEVEEVSRGLGPMAPLKQTTPQVVIQMGRITRVRSSSEAARTLR